MRKKEHTAEEIYFQKLYAPEPPLLSELRETLSAKRLSIHVSPDEGQLLALLVRMHQPKQIVEIGTLGGYSAMWMASALEGDGHITTFEKSSGNAAIAREFIARSPHAARITLVEGDAHAMIRTHPFAQGVDMVFIDAEKEGYPDYLDWADSVLKPGGVIVGDNTRLFGAAHLDSPPEGMAEAMWRAMRAFNQKLADPSRYHTAFIPTEEGMTIAIKK